eukprot:961858-Pelagomonas_calceolata.AAC.1
MDRQARPHVLATALGEVHETHTPHVGGLSSLSFMAISGGAAGRSSGGCLLSACVAGSVSWELEQAHVLDRAVFVVCGIPCTYGSCSRGCCNA